MSDENEFKSRYDEPFDLDKATERDRWVIAMTVLHETFRLLKQGGPGGTPDALLPAAIDRWLKLHPDYEQALIDIVANVSEDFRDNRDAPSFATAFLIAVFDEIDQLIGH